METTEITSNIEYTKKSGKIYRQKTETQKIEIDATARLAIIDEEIAKLQEMVDTLNDEKTKLQAVT